MTTASIIILAKNEERNIGSCLEAIFDQSFQGDYEVIVIDSGSTDRTVEIARRYPTRLEQIRPEEFHHGRTRNMGARLARGKYLVFVTADATPSDRHWLRNLLQGIEAPEVAGCYGRQLARPWAYPMERFFLSSLYPPEPRVQRKTGRSVDMDATWFSNVNSVIKKELWEKHPFSESAFMSEDQLWSREVLDEGFTLVYNPESAVYHTHNYSLIKAFRRYFDSGMTSEESYLPGGIKQPMQFFLRGLSYLGNELLFLLRHGYFLWSPYALAYESMKFIGIMAGRQHRNLPRRLVKLLSHNCREAPSLETGRP